MIPSEELIKQVRAEIGPRTLLAFSGGKDSLASFIALRPHFDEVIPYYLYRVPGLQFVEDQLAYYEKAMAVRIIRLPHEALPRWLNSSVYQSPGNFMVIEACRENGLTEYPLPEHDYSHIIEWAAEIAGLAGKEIMAAVGIRAADSPQRRLTMMKHGPISRESRQYYPIWDWNKDRIVSAIAASGIKLSRDYELFGRSFDGLDYRFLGPLKRHYPEDWKKLLTWFPLAGAEVFRYEQMGGRLETD